MKRIGIYFFCVVALGCVTSGILYWKNEKYNEIRLEKTAQSETENDVEVATQTFDNMVNASEVTQTVTEMEEARFCVKEVEGYLVIFDGVTMEKYDETTIRVSDLPERFHLMIVDGLYFSDEEELYAFLENYSS